MQYFVYIGRDSKTIELLSRLSIGVFYAAPNCSKAVKVLSLIHISEPTRLGMISYAVFCLKKKKKKKKKNKKKNKINKKSKKTQYNNNNTKS